MASSEQPVAETSGNVNIVDTAAYEQQIQALQKRAAEAEEKFQGIKGKLDDVYKNKTISAVKTLKSKASGNLFGKKPTNQALKKTSGLLS